MTCNQRTWIAPWCALDVSFLHFLTTIGLSGTLVGLVARHAATIMPFALRPMLAAIAGFDCDAATTAVWPVALPMILAKAANCGGRE